MPQATVGAKGKHAKNDVWMLKVSRTRQPDCVIFRGQKITKIDYPL